MSKRKREPKAPRVRSSIHPALIIVGAICFAGLLGLNGTLFYFQMKSNEKLSQYIDDDRKYNLSQLDTNGYIEDGYIVADEYEIRSTKAISDAYINNDTSELSEQELKTYDLACEVLDEVIEDDMDLYEKEVAIYTWICKNIAHSSGYGQSVNGLSSAEMVSTPLGVLSGKESVCVGYATTFRLLMNMLGADCHIVHNEYHSWDLVQMEDGSWYHVDIYSDAPDATFSNFNMTDAMARSGHDWKDYGYLPAADQYEYCYAKKNCEELPNIDEIPTAVTDRAIGNTDSFTFFYNASGLDKDDLSKLEIIGGLLSTVFETGKVEGLENKYLAYEFIDFPEIEEKIFAIHVYDYNEDDTDDQYTENENYANLYEEMENLFKKLYGDDVLDYDYSDDYYYEEDDNVVYN